MRASEAELRKPLQHWHRPEASSTHGLCHQLALGRPPAAPARWGVRVLHKTREHEPSQALLRSLCDKQRWRADLIQTHQQVTRTGMGTCFRDQQPPSLGYAE